MKNVLEAENFDMWDGGEKKKDGKQPGWTFKTFSC